MEHVSGNDYVFLKEKILSSITPILVDMYVYLKSKADFYMTVSHLFKFIVLTLVSVV